MPDTKTFAFINVHVHLQPEARPPQVWSLRNVILSREQVDTGPCSVGIHPWYITDDGKEQVAELANMILNTPNLLAIGECGLDKVCKTDWSLQEAVFRAQLRLAEESKKPVIVHCVRAYQELLHTLASTVCTQPIILHGYRKGWTLAEQFMRREHIYLSLGATILQGQMDEFISKVPLHRIFLETDQEDISIEDIYAYFCRVRKIALTALQEQVIANYEDVFQKQ